MKKSNCGSHIALPRRPGVFLLLLTLAARGASEPDLHLDFRTTHAQAGVVAADAVLEATGTGLVVRTGTSNRWPGVTAQLTPTAGDFSRARDAVVTVRNLDPAPLEIHARIDAATRTADVANVSGKIRLPPGAAGAIRLRLHQTQISFDRPLALHGMRTAPGEMEKDLDPARLERLMVFVADPATSHVFAVESLAGVGRVTPLRADEFLPFIDEFGQCRPLDWPGKIRAGSDFAAHAAAEERDIAANPEPAGRDRWGGWADGPQLASNGFFRVEKRDGKWWLVDPDGRLFWSHGVTCVRPSADTPITDRESYFAWLPAAGDPLSAFFGEGSWAPHGYYHGRGTYRTFDFSRANLRRKFGTESERAHADLTHRRLRSWGMNTIANWSDERIYALRRTPYTATLSPHSPPIEGSEGFWGKFPDPFHPEFRVAVRNAAEKEKGEAAGDPWCLGFFVHNELAWGDETSLALASLKSPATQPARQRCLAWLREKHGDLDALNQTWGTSNTTWEALSVPGGKAARADLVALYDLIAREYFRVIREELKAVAPQQLYLGCRFAWGNPIAIRAAADSCDVIGFNLYRDSLADWSLPVGVDRPVIVGEFHFGALDRGLFHTGLRPTASQEARAEAYRRYVGDGLRHPRIVGTHWFQYRDQATTGRGDGENYQIGLVDICDTPYPETIRAVREMGAAMYRLRSESSAGAP
jgi:hypothetical protein